MKSFWTVHVGTAALALGMMAAQVHAAEADQAPEADSAKRSVVSDADIVVVATRREQALQDVPIAISAFGAETLAKSRIESIADLSIGTPGLKAASAGVGVTPFLRGVGQPTTTPGGESPIAMYVDGVYQPMLWVNGTPFNNIERVEVLKGPQGTLFGRNATGGLIHVITRDPSETFGGNVSLSYGNYETVTAKAYVEGGLADGVAMDMAVYYNNQGDGWGRNYDSPQGRFGSPGKKIGPAEEIALRSKLLAKLSDRLTVTITGDYRNADSSYGYNYRIVDGGLGQDGLPPVPGYYNSVVTPGRAFGMKSEVWSVSGKVAYDFDSFRITSQTSYQDVKVNQIFDNDNITEDLVSANTVSGINKTFQEELQIASTGDGPFSWIGGFYYLDMEGGFGGQKGIQLGGTGLGLPPGTALDIRNRIKTRSYAVFAELNYDLTDSTTLTLGGRYTWDKRNLVGTTQLDGTFGGYNPIATLATTDIKTSFKEPTYRAILKHEFSRKAMVYASYSHGFKSGNFNPIDPSNPPFDPEKLDAYEIGFKGSTVDGTFSLNTAAFYYDYSNLQFEVNTGTSTITQNATSTEIKGFELDATIRPVHNLTVTLGYAFVDGKYKNFANASCYTPNPSFDPTVLGSTVNLPTPCDASGTPIIRTPRHAINAAINYSVPMGSGATDFNLTYQTSSKTRFDLQGRLVQKPVDMLNGSIFWKGSNGLKIGLFGKNLINEKYSNYYIEQAYGDYYTAAPPRTYGIELGYQF